MIVKAYVSKATSAVFTLCNYDAIAIHVASENQFATRSILRMSHYTLSRIGSHKRPILPTVKVSESRKGG